MSHADACENMPSSHISSHGCSLWAGAAWNLGLRHTILAPAACSLGMPWVRSNWWQCSPARSDMGLGLNEGLDLETAACCSCSGALGLVAAALPPGASLLPIGKAPSLSLTAIPGARAKDLGPRAGACSSRKAAEEPLPIVTEPVAGSDLDDICKAAESRLSSPPCCMAKVSAPKASSVWPGRAVGVLRSASMLAEEVEGLKTGLLRLKALPPAGVLHRIGHRSQQMVVIGRHAYRSGRDCSAWPYLCKLDSCLATWPMNS